MTRFLDEFLSDAHKCAPIATEALPIGERDVLLLDPSLFAQDPPEAHDHSHDDKIGGCGTACGGCSKRGTPACGEHTD